MQTLSSTIKTKNIIPEKMLERASNRFVPVNPSEAKFTIERQVPYQPIKDYLEVDISIRDDQLDQTLHQSQFKRSSPSPTELKKDRVINSINKFQTFLPTQFENPRLTVLQNFKEISRIMTNSFLQQKKYKNSSLPQDEFQQKMIENTCTNKMAQIMKKLYSPKSFCSPLRKSCIKDMNKSMMISKTISSDQRRSLAAEFNQEVLFRSKRENNQSVTLQPNTLESTLTQSIA